MPDLPPVHMRAQVMSKAQLPLLTSVIMLGQAFLSAPAGLRAKRSIADRNQVPPNLAAFTAMTPAHVHQHAAGMISWERCGPGLHAGPWHEVYCAGRARSSLGSIHLVSLAQLSGCCCCCCWCAQVLLVGYAAMIAADMAFALMPTYLGACRALPLETPAPLLHEQRNRHACQCDSMSTYRYVYALQIPGIWPRRRCSSWICAAN